MDRKLLLRIYTLEQRPVELCRRLASGLQESPEFCGWLPSSRSERHGRNLRSKNKLTVMQPEHRDSCVAQLHTSQTCSINIVCARLYVVPVSINNGVFFLTNFLFYTLYTTFIQPTAAKLLVVKINHYYYYYYYYYMYTLCVRTHGDRPASLPGSDIVLALTDTRTRADT